MVLITIPTTNSFNATDLQTTEGNIVGDFNVHRGQTEDICVCHQKTFAWEQTKNYLVVQGTCTIA